MTMPRQLALALPHAENFSRDDFLVGASNEAALSLVERWPDWPDRALAIVGPEGAGKSHLAAIWADITGARRVSARVLDEINLPAALATGALVVEDAAERLDERALFHLLNLMRQQEAFILLTTRTLPATWRIGLADLASRLRAIPTVELRPPDDALLRAVMVKLFADRQLAIDETLIAYLLTRIERSFGAARAAVQELDREALRQKRPVTRALAAELLGQA
jgi:chromosomal replication initiation ATPase DnaA